MRQGGGRGGGTEEGSGHSPLLRDLHLSSSDLGPTGHFLPSAISSSSSAFHASLPPPPGISNSSSTNSLSSSGSGSGSTSCGSGQGGPSVGLSLSPSSSSSASSPLSLIAAANAGGGASGCPVLQILTNNHFVPTQAWPVEPMRDSVYVSLIVEELRSIGGTTTVSKLRGLLKHKLGSKETVKSVPLKALLQAYGGLFSLHRNHVSLQGAMRL